MKYRLLAVAFAVALGGLSAPAADQSTIVSSVGFITGRIGANDYWFLIDTGANRSALDGQVAGELGLLTGGTSKVEGSAGEVRAEEALIRQLRLGNTIVRNLNPTVYDLSGSLAPAGEHIAGILGIDAMRDSAVLWDSVGKNVRLARNAANLASLRGATILPFVLDNGIPKITVRIDGTPMEMRIDTGAAIGDGPVTYVNVTKAAYDRLRSKNPSLAPYTYFSASGVGGDIQIPVVKAHSLTLGGVTIPEPHLIVQQPVGYFARPDAIGFLGGYAFKHWRGFIVDYPRKRLILLPRPTKTSAVNGGGGRSLSASNLARGS